MIEQPSSFSPKPEENLPVPKEVVLPTAEGHPITLKEYHIGEAPEGGFVSPGNMETGNLDEIEKFYGDDPARINNFVPGATLVPYDFLFQEGNNVYGNYTTDRGQDEFMDTDLALTKDSYSPPEWVRELQGFARAKNPKIFTTDSNVACVRSLALNSKGQIVFTLGSGLYSDSFYSNGAEGVRIGLNDKEKEILSRKLSLPEMEKLIAQTTELENRYGIGRTMRDIVISHYGHLPEFGEHACNNSIGVAGMVLTRTNEFIFVKRGSQVSVNQGVNCTASGAAEFDEAFLSRHGMQHFLGSEMSNETNQELGLKPGTLLLGSMKKRIELELGVNEGEYDLVPVGFIRELPRGGKPECMFLIRYKGSTEDLVRKVIANPHADKKEIEGSVFSIPSGQTDMLLKTKGAASFIQHKGIANLMLCNEYLENHPS